eukprot:GILK01006804.1.p1 GENE.GILK01006804.1~~GILK01006804.1.p1  ORF type:complete len:353 (+),score=54.76 GILK01006804.1:75-1061(+)
MEAHKSCLSKRVCIKPTWDSSSRGVVIPKPSSFSDLQDLVRKALELGDTIAFRVFLVGSGEIKEWAFELIRDGDVLEVEVDYGSLMEQTHVEVSLEKKPTKLPLKTEQATADAKKSKPQQKGHKKETSKRKRESDASLAAASKQHKTGSKDQVMQPDQQANSTISSSVSAHLPVPVSSSIPSLPVVPLPNQAVPTSTSVSADASSETQLQGQPNAATQAEQQQPQVHPTPSATRTSALPVNVPSPSPSEHEVMVIQSSDRRRRISVKVTPTQTVRALLPIIQRQWGLSAADYDLFKGNDNVLSAFRSFGDLCQREREVRLILVPQESY